MKKSISTINLANTENTEHSIVKVHAPIVNLKMGGSLDHDCNILNVPTTTTLHVSITY